jgi:hypothetical protein
MARVVHMVQRLQARAAGGDRGAQLELAKLRALAPQLIVEHVAPHLPLEEAVSPAEAFALPAGDMVLEETQARAERLEPSHVDELSHKGALKQREFDEAKGIAPYVRVNPVSGRKGTLGNIARNVTAAGGVVAVAFWVADSHDEALPVTVNLAPVNPRVPSNALQGTTLPPRPFGIVTFGNRGVTQSVKVDVGRGCQFTVNGSSVAIELGMDIGVGGPNVPAQMDISGWLSFWSCNQTVPVMSTIYLDNVAAGDSRDVSIPAYAQTLLPVQMSNANGNLTLTFKDTNHTPQYVLTLAAPGAQITPIPITNDIVQVTVANTAAVAQNIRLPFQVF